MTERAQHRRLERTEREPVARRERRRQRPVLGARAEVAGAEDDGCETAHIVDGERSRPARRTSIDAPLAGARRQGSAGIVAASLATTQVASDRADRRDALRGAVRDSAGRIDDAAGARRAGAAPASRRRLHGALLGAGASRSRSIMSTISRAASRGRFSVAGSASGSAVRVQSACPCRRDRRARTRDAVRARSSSFQIRLSCSKRRLARAVGAPAG